MYCHLFLLCLMTLLCSIQRTCAKAVFAHYLVGTVTEDHAQQDIEDAVAMGLDGFALNVGDPTQTFVNDTLRYLFAHAETKGFKLFLSMDVFASGAACFAGSSSCNGALDYISIFQQYANSSAWYVTSSGSPLLSTFSSGGFTNSQWGQWIGAFPGKVHFIPDFDDTYGYYNASPAWYSYWGSVMDGLFSWESAWPEREGLGGLFPGDVSPDVTVARGAAAYNKTYMMGLSPLQYKNSFGTNVYRAGDLNLPQRMANILSMDPQPDFVEVQTWNDGPESHYLGSVWPEQGSDNESVTYVNSNFTHAAWQPLVGSFIEAWKVNGSTASMKPPRDSTSGIGVLWYKTILQNASCPGDTNGTLYYQKPDGFITGSDTLNWAVVLPPDAINMTANIITANTTFLGIVSLQPGLNYGSAPGVAPGPARLELLDAKSKVVMVAQGGRDVSSGCPDGIYNMNYQVVGLSNVTDLSTPSSVLTASAPPPSVTTSTSSTSSSQLTASTLLTRTSSASSSQPTSNSSSRPRCGIILLICSAFAILLF